MAARPSQVPLLKNPLLNQLLRARARRNLLVQVIRYHVFLQFSGIRLQGRSGVEGCRKNILYRTGTQISNFPENKKKNPYSQQAPPFPAYVQDSSSNSPRPSGGRVPVVQTGSIYALNQPVTGSHATQVVSNRSPSNPNLPSLILSFFPPELHACGVLIIVLVYIYPSMDEGVEHTARYPGPQE